MRAGKNRVVSDDLALRVIASLTMLLFALFFSGLTYYGYRRGEAPARRAWIKKSEQPINYAIQMALIGCVILVLIGGIVRLLSI